MFLREPRLQLQYFTHLAQVDIGCAIIVIEELIIIIELVRVCLVLITSIAGVPVVVIKTVISKSSSLSSEFDRKWGKLHSQDDLRASISLHMAHNYIRFMMANRKTI